MAPAPGRVLRRHRHPPRRPYAARSRSSQTARESRRRRTGRSERRSRSPTLRITWQSRARACKVRRAALVGSAAAAASSCWTALPSRTNDDAGARQVNETPTRGSVRACVSVIHDHPGILHARVRRGAALRRCGRRRHVRRGHVAGERGARHDRRAQQSGRHPNRCNHRLGVSDHHRPPIELLSLSAIRARRAAGSPMPHDHGDARTTRRRDRRAGDRIRSASVKGQRRDYAPGVTSPLSYARTTA